MGGTDDPPSFCRQKGAAPLSQMCMSVSRVSVFIYFPAVIFISMSEFSTIHFRDISMRRIVTAIFLFECDDTLM
jgi:hypothetical protein